GIDDIVDFMEHEAAHYLYASTLGEKEFHKVEGYVTVLKIIGGWFSLPLESFTQFDFGTRYYNGLKVIMASMVLLLTLFMMTGVSELMRLYTGQASGDVPPFWLLPVFLIAASVQIGRIWYRDNVLDMPWHSHSNGISAFSFLNHIDISKFTSDLPVLRWLPDRPFTSWWIARVGHPFICLGVGQCLIWADAPLLGGWVMMSALMLSIKNNMMYQGYRGRILDVKDAQIEQQYLDASLSGKESKRQMAECPLPVASWQGATTTAYPGRYAEEEQRSHGVTGGGHCAGTSEPGH
ncbi:MAG: hypothetical protein AAF682_31750, partial [Planctomycetota bacterium]